MSIFNKLKDFFENIKAKFYEDDEEDVYRKALQREAARLAEINRQNRLELFPDISNYEIRRKDVSESSEPVEGIFYIYNGKIIPDYYSECLMSDKENKLKKEMYHYLFYRNYMARKFDELGYSEKSLPRGRISLMIKPAIIYIDLCFISDKDILDELMKLYRLPEDVRISNLDYRCPACRDFDNVD